MTVILLKPYDCNLTWTKGDASVYKQESDQIHRLVIPELNLYVRWNRAGIIIERIENFQWNDTAVVKELVLAEDGCFISGIKTMYSLQLNVAQAFKEFEALSPITFPKGWG